MPQRLHRQRNCQQCQQINGSKDKARRRVQQPIPLSPRRGSKHEGRHRIEFDGSIAQCRVQSHRPNVKSKQIMSSSIHDVKTSGWLTQQSCAHENEGQQGPGEDWPSCPSHPVHGAPHECTCNQSAAACVGMAVTGNKVRRLSMSPTLSGGRSLPRRGEFEGWDGPRDCHVHAPTA